MTDMASGSPRVPEHPSVDGLEQRWSRTWQEDRTYAFDRSADRANVYAIDTPPPTVSGSLHIGHVFSFTHTDIIARYQRMRGKVVFYPMGWDDNGLATERRVQNYFGVRCEPSLPYDPDVALPPKPDVKNLMPISRKLFLELCARLTAEDEQAFEELWRRLGLSVDWSYQYTTIGTQARAASQRAFLRNLARREAYLAEAPTLWDVSFATAVAQAELEDRPWPGAYHELRFAIPSAGPERYLSIDTTRPELLAACVALVCHPDDARYAAQVGTYARTPVYEVEVPIHAHPLADPTKGTGLAMVCTFGDLTDVTWWRDLHLDTRVIIGRDGCLLPQPPAGVATEPYSEVAGCPVPVARERIVDALRERGELLGEPRPVTHAVKFYENGDAPLEIVGTRQWYLSNGGRLPDLRDQLMRLGRALRWVPEHMRHRYEHWVGGLTGDWLISRQRFSGVPFPIWYRLDDEGNPDLESPLLPAESDLPVDPSTDLPDGFAETDRGRPGGFAADPDVMDTWATSSLTPLIVGGWERDPDLFSRVFPMDLRPQSHEIIRTWLFSTVVRSRAEFGVLPWHTVAISGWILDPDRKKMSKSKGNVVTPMALLERFSSDAVRYWAAKGRPGIDFTFDEGEMKVGRRLVTKLLNAAKFVLGLEIGDVPCMADVTEALDRSMLARLSTVIATATQSFEAMDYAAALATVDAFFWDFCDNYIELVKQRMYGEGPLARSARAALRLALDVQVRLFAPVLPYVTEEVWSWWHEGAGALASVHRAPWPAVDEIASDGDPHVLLLATAALAQVRRAKSERSLSMRAEVISALVQAPRPALDRLSLAAADLRAAGRIASLDLAATPEPASTGDRGEAGTTEAIDLAVTCSF
jgi:valyl-tRNA synthetase